MTETTRFVRAAIVMFLDTLLVMVLICLFFLDKLVNEILYDYGLVFSYGWAEPYWLWMRISMALIGIAIFTLSALEFLYPLLHRKSAHRNLCTCPKNPKSYIPELVLGMTHC